MFICILTSILICLMIGRLNIDGILKLSGNSLSWFNTHGIQEDQISTQTA